MDVAMQKILSIQRITKNDLTPAKAAEVKKYYK